jgi:hypothetical protein
MHEQNMSDSQQENISHLLDHVEEQTFKLSDIIETEIEDKELAQKLLEYVDKADRLLLDLREQIY